MKRMKRFLFVMTIAVFYATNVFAIDMTGTWYMEATWTNPSGQTGSQTTVWVFENQSQSKDFIGKIYDLQGTFYGIVKGKVTSGSNEVVLFERFDVPYSYYASSIGRPVDANHINNGSFIDTAGNVGSFTMHK